MKPRKQRSEHVDDLFRSRLDNLINMRHELVVLANRIDWDYLDNQAGQFFSDEGRPAHPTRLMVGLQLLKYLFNLSDEGICERWVYDPYFQYFTGETYFQHKLPLVRSDLTHWRQRLGEDFCVRLLQESLRVAHSSGALRTKEMKRVVIDTTVQEKTITYPTEAKLRYKALLELGNAAKCAGIALRQSYVRVGKLAVIKSGRYRHAKQMKRAKKAEKYLKTRLGRLIRDVERKQDGLSEKQIALLKVPLGKAKQIDRQKIGDADYLYSWHCPEVECIGKGKVHKPYEFGNSVIEPIIGHTKHDCRMDRNYLHGTLGDQVNAVMAAVGYNFRRLLVWFRQLLWPFYYCLHLRSFLNLHSKFVQKVGC